MNAINFITTPSDLRPIAHLCVNSKLLERVVHQHLIEYLRKNKLLTDRQIGYRSGYSTQSSLIELVDDIKRGINNFCITILVLFNFSKAFNTVNHKILLTKLRKLNFGDREIEWFYSYLTGRSQAVLINKVS